MNSYTLEGFSFRDRFKKTAVKKTVVRKKVSPIRKNKFNLQSYRDRTLAGFYEDDFDVLGWSVKKSLKKAKKAVTKNVVKGLKAVDKEINDLPKDIVKGVKKTVKENLNLDKLTEVTNTVIDSALNSLPVISTVNQTLEAVGIDVSAIPAELQTKIISKGTDIIKDATGLTAQNKTASGNNQTGNTGAFMSFVKAHKDLYNFDLNEQQLNIINPDELYDVVKQYIDATGLPVQPKKCDSVIDADIAKIYYYFVGQPRYNGLGDVAYKSIRTISNDFDKLITQKAWNFKTQATSAGNNNNLMFAGLGIAGIVTAIMVMKNR